jgi:hypothetical protein
MVAWFLPDQDAGCDSGTPPPPRSVALIEISLQRWQILNCAQLIRSTFAWGTSLSFDF